MNTNIIAVTIGILYVIYIELLGKWEFSRIDRRERVRPLPYAVLTLIGFIRFGIETKLAIRMIQGQNILNDEIIRSYGTTLLVCCTMWLLGLWRLARPYEKQREAASKDKASIRD